jgi:hypothetical protein
LGFFKRYKIQSVSGKPNTWQLPKPTQFQPPSKLTFCSRAKYLHYASNGIAPSLCF